MLFTAAHTKKHLKVHVKNKNRNRNGMCCLEMLYNFENKLCSNISYNYILLTTKYIKHINKKTAVISSYLGFI